MVSMRISRIFGVLFETEPVLSGLFEQPARSKINAVSRTYFIESP